MDVIGMGDDVLDKDSGADPRQNHVTITREDVRAANKRVGTSAREQLQWALDFANKDVSIPSLGTVLDLFLELFAFSVASHRRDEVNYLPIYFTAKGGELIAQARDEVQAVHELFAYVLRSYVDGEEAIIENNGPTQFMLSPSGAFGFSMSDSRTWSAVKLMDLVGELPEHVHQCPKDQHGCGNWFLSERKDAVFCSKTCAGRKRGIDFREREEKKKTGAKHAKG